MAKKHHCHVVIILTLIDLYTLAAFLSTQGQGLRKEK